MAKKKVAKKKSTARVSSPKKSSVNRHLNTSSEHNVFKIVVTTMIVWGIVLVAIIYMLHSIQDHNYQMMNHY